VICAIKRDSISFRPSFAYIDNGLHQFPRMKLISSYGVPRRCSTGSDNVDTTPLQKSGLLSAASTYM
jgi:hypothetical protein